MKAPLRNSALVLAGDGISRIVAFLVNVYLARILDPTGFGIITIGLSVLSYLQLIASPGIQMIETRNVAALAMTDAGRISSVITVRLVLSAVIAVLTAGAASIVPDVYSELSGVVLLYSLSLLPLALSLDWFFQAKESFGIVSLAKVIQSVSYAAAVVLLVHGPGDIREAAISFALSSLIAAGALLLVFQKREGGIHFVLDPPAWRQILRENAPVGAAVLLGQSVVNLPPLAIGFFLTVQQAGYYGASFKLVSLLLVVDRLLNMILLPVVSRHFAHRRDEWAILMKTILKWTLAGTIVLVWGTILLSPNLVVAVFGKEFTESITPAQLLFMYGGLTLVHSIFVLTLIAAGKEAEYVRAMTAGSLATVVLILVLTGVGGLLGACIGVCIGELATLSLMGWRARQYLDKQLGATLVRFVPGLAVLVALSFIFTVASSLAAALSTLAAFIVVLAISGAVTRRDVRMLLERVA